MDKRHPWNGVRPYSQQAISIALPMAKVDPKRKPCILCKRPHWRPDIKPVCVGCEAKL